MPEAATLETPVTPTTNGTGTPPEGGSGTGTNPPKTGTTNEGIAAALGDGTGAPPVKADGTGDKPGDAAPKDAAKPAAGAPEKYEAWKVPEGYELDTGLVEEVSPLFRELNLTQEQSQKLVDFYAKHGIKTAEEQAAANQTAFWDMRRAWRESLKSDEMTKGLVDDQGNHGPKSPLISTINDALNGLQNPKLVADFKQGMELTGAGDNPAFVKVLYSLAKQVTEGSSYASGNPVQRKEMPKSAAAAIFPHLPSASG